MIFYRENLMEALIIAIREREAAEKQLNYFTDSALLAGWRELLQKLEEGDTINLI
jgi:hypothetical protein